MDPVADDFAAIAARLRELKGEAPKPADPAPAVHGDVQAAAVKAYIAGQGPAQWVYQG